MVGLPVPVRFPAYGGFQHDRFGFPDPCDTVLHDGHDVRGRIPDLHRWRRENYYLCGAFGFHSCAAS